MILRLFITLFLILICSSGHSQDKSPDALSRLYDVSTIAIELYEAQSLSEPIETPEQLLDKAVSEYDSERIVFLLKNHSLESGFNEIYLKVAEVFANEDIDSETPNLQWLEECVNNQTLSIAHKCAISLGMINLSKFNTTSLLDWAVKASEISTSIPKTDERYWYMQHQSNDLLLVAFIFDRNIEEAAETGLMYVKSARMANVKLHSANVINNIAYLAGNELGPEAAIEILQPANEKLSIFNEDEKGVIYYSLGKNHMLAGEFNKALYYYRLFSRLDNRSDLVPAAEANLAYIYAKLNMFDEAKKSIEVAINGLSGNLESNLGINILKAKKMVLVNENKLLDALNVIEEINRIDDLLDERELSANRNRLSKNLQITNERMKRREDKLVFEAELSAQKAKSRQIQLFLSFLALSILMAMLVAMYRGFRREQKLNAVIQVKNEKLHESNIHLSKTNEDLRRTYQSLRVAHKQAMAGQDAKQKFIGVVGHELRTPLNPIINLASVLEDKASDAKDRALLKAIKNAGKRLHIIVENMLAISSSDKDSQVFIEMVNVIYDVKTIIEEFLPDINERNEALRKGGDYLNVNIYKHPDLKENQVSNKIIFRSIVRNLVDNALKFTPNGDISLHLRPRKSGPGFEFEIRDSGLGMDLSKIDQLMRPFEQAEMGLGRSHEGAGLGLAVVQKYCEQLGAKLNIRSTLKSGTRITIDFPEPAHESDTGKLLKVA